MYKASHTLCYVRQGLGLEAQASVTTLLRTGSCSGGGGGGSRSSRCRRLGTVH